MEAAVTALQELSRRARECLASGGSVAVIGVGNELCGDDIAGLLVAQKVQARSLPRLVGFIGGPAPENITGEVAQSGAHLVIFVDAADVGLAPGGVKLIPLEEIRGVSFSTHTLPLYVIIDYLAQRMQSKFAVIGIQPADASFGAPVVQAVRDAAQEVADALSAAAC